MTEKSSSKRDTFSPFRIIPVEDRHLVTCEAFIAAREWACAYLSEKFIAFRSEKRTSEKPQATEFFMLREGEKDEGCRGVLFVSRGGKVLHCLSRQTLESKAWKNELRSFFGDRKVVSIMGEAKANRFLEKICGRLSFNASSFILMRRFRNGSREELTPKIRHAAKEAAAHICSEKDAEELLPLQIAYEAEELGAKSGEEASEKTLMRLKACLRQQTVIACRDALTGKLLGKAGTNAKGMGWNQIGGVYTLPAERNKGVAQFMVSELAHVSAREGKDAVLFVKPKNKAAQAAYAKSGFKECGEFRMAVR